MNLQIDDTLNETSQFVKDEDGSPSVLALSTAAVGIGTTKPKGAAGIQPYSADRVLDVDKPDWAESDDIQLHVGDLILNSRHSGSSDVEADNKRGANGNLGLGAKGVIFFYTQDSETAFSIKVWFDNNGNVGIGTEQPKEKLEVHGNILATGDVILMGADCAEDFDVSDPTALEKGMVVVIGEEERLHPCTTAYDSRVAGVLSGAGDCRPAIILGKEAVKTGRLPLALTGKVYCKVDASYGPVNIGDLLTTSATLGHAMKAGDAGRAFGAVLGKALRPLPSGCGLIPILVALQ